MNPTSHPRWSTCLAVFLLALSLGLPVQRLQSAEPASTNLLSPAFNLADAADLPELAGVEFHVIKKWDREADGYTFLHGVALAWHRNRLYASFGHNRGSENTVSEEAHYRVSDDGGKSWGPLRVIDRGEEPRLAVSHGVMLSHAGQLWAWQGAYYDRMQRVHTRLFRLNESNHRWESLGVVIEGGFWPMNQPVKNDDGNWVMPGFCAGPYSNQGIFPAAVALSHGDDLTKWDLVRIPASSTVKSMWGESAIVVDGFDVINLARYGTNPIALVARSRDGGRTWSASQPSNLPMTTSKPAAGTLSNGQRYLIATTARNNGKRRSPLTIAVSSPGENLLSKVFVIRRATNEEHPGESASRLSLAYPYAVEHEGKLYVGYSNNGGRKGNLNSAELAIVPIDSLRVD